MIDTHAHIYDEAFQDDRDEMLLRAFNSGVKEIWMPNCYSGTIEGMLSLEEKYPTQCYPMMGLHPSYVKEDFESELKIIESRLSSRKFLMIGEIGLDFYWDLKFVEEQREVFLFHLEQAKKYNYSICIHSRNSKDNSLNAIQACCDLIEDFSWPGLKGIFHCFSGNIEDAKRVQGLNFKLGIGGVITYKNATLPGLVEEIGLENIVLETDAPYLAPTPNRGKRNEVAYVNLVANKIADLLNKPVEEVTDQTNKNAYSLVRN